MMTAQAVPTTDDSSKYVFNNRKEIEEIIDTDAETVACSEIEGGSSEDEPTALHKEKYSRDKTITAGNRLYSQAMDQHRRHEDRRREALEHIAKLELATQSDIGQKVRSVVCKKNQELLKNRPQKTTKTKTDAVKSVNIEVLKNAPVPERCNRLYELSNNEQILGKQRRTLIEEKKAKASSVPDKKILPVSKAGDMYSRSMERLIAQRLKLAALAEEIGSTRFYE